MKRPKCHFDNPSDSSFCSKRGTKIQAQEDIGFSQTETLQTPIKELTTGSTFASRYQIIEELGKEAGNYFITMEYVSGEDLKSFNHEAFGDSRTRGN
jgi:hypothetical protein